MIKLKDILNEEYWGTKEQPFYYKGPNPVVDLVIVQNDKILLIRRSQTSDAEPGKWALPGGFHDTNAQKGGVWRNDKETALDAAVREVKEETNLDVNIIKNNIKEIGIFEGNNRDPRDNKISWTKSTAFYLRLPDDYDISNVKGMDDADKASFFNIDELDKLNIAFDHRDIIKQGLTSYND